MGVGIDAFNHLLYIVLVVVVGSVDTQIEILRTDDFVEDRELKTLVAGLTNVLELIAVTGCLGYRHLHQDVLRRVPVGLDATTELSIPETVVNT